jgi:hypothetical protein
MMTTTDSNQIVTTTVLSHHRFFVRLIHQTSHHQRSQPHVLTNVLLRCPTLRLSHLVPVLHRGSIPPSKRGPITALLLCHFLAHTSRCHRCCCALLPAHTRSLNTVPSLGLSRTTPRPIPIPTLQPSPSPSPSPRSWHLPPLGSLVRPLNSALRPTRGLTDHHAISLRTSRATSPPITPLVPKRLPMNSTATTSSRFLNGLCIWSKSGTVVLRPPVLRVPQSAALYGTTCWPTSVPASRLLAVLGLPSRCGSMPATHESTPRRAQRPTPTSICSPTMMNYSRPLMPLRRGHDRYVLLSKALLH